MSDKLRFGVIGCSGIAERSTIPAIKNSQFAELQMIGSRSEKKAEEFARKFGCQNFGTYEEILENKEVDAVYISVPIGLHEEWTAKAAKAGKHVLCEKSSTTSYESACKMVDVCKQNSVRLMEGFMFRFHPQHKKVLELIKNGMLGKLFVFNGMYGFPPIPLTDIRFRKDLGGGILNDAGCYPICASRIIFGEEPLGVFCNLSIDTKTQVDTKASLYLTYDDMKSAQMSVGYDLFFQSTYSIWGSEGFLNLTRSYNIPSDMKATMILSNKIGKQEILIEPSDHFLIMVDSFCKGITNSFHEFDFEEDLLKQARIMQAARISFNEKRFVKIDEV
ncbi:MAG: Gfo/Idh/MocA family protein [Nitrosotalea sp.]